MKVQGLNSSSKKTKNLIKNTFVELINEKKELSKITVTELVKRAQITRSTFYTHYDNIYEVAKDYELQTIELLVHDDLEFHSMKDIEEYFNDIIDCLKQNETTYKMLLSSNDTIFFLENLRKIAENKIYSALKEIIRNDEYLELNVSFLIDASMGELFKYFRNESKYSLDELLVNIKKLFRKIFE